MDHIIEEMVFYFTVLVVMSKAMTYLIAKEKIKKLLDMLDSEMFQPETSAGMQTVSKAQKFNVRCWKVTAAVSYYTFFLHQSAPYLAHWFIATPLYLNTCSYDFLNEDLKQKFIFPIAVYQSVGMHFNMLYNLNIDTFFLGLLIFAIAQLELLEEKLTNITIISRNERQNRNSEVVLSNESVFSTKLNKAIVHYEKVSVFCHLIEEVFSVTLFVQFSMASCIICVCLFRFTMPATMDYYVFLGGYITTMILQILMPCWFGSRIMDKSSRLSGAAYSCDWTPRARRFTSSLRLFVERANRPLLITGCKLFPLSLNTFTSIMNSAYSFQTLLRNMQTREA